jgi:hypothetical protein
MREAALIVELLRTAGASGEILPPRWCGSTQAASRDRDLDRARRALESVRAGKGDRVALAPPVAAGSRSPAAGLGIERD